MKSQQGLTVISLLLGLVIISSLLAISVPSVLRYGERITAQGELVNVVHDTFTSMEQALAAHWANTQCRTAPTGITLASLVQHHGLNEEVLNAPWHLTADYPHPSQMRITIRAVDSKGSHFALRAMAKTSYQVAQSGNNVMVINNVPTTSTHWQRINRRPGEECFVR